MANLLQHQEHLRVLLLREEVELQVQVTALLTLTRRAWFLANRMKIERKIASTDNTRVSSEKGNGSNGLGLGESQVENDPAGKQQHVDPDEPSPWRSLGMRERCLSALDSRTIVTVYVTADANPSRSTQPRSL